MDDERNSLICHLRASKSKSAAMKGLCLSAQGGWTRCLSARGGISGKLVVVVVVVTVVVVIVAVLRFVLVS